MSRRLERERKRRDQQRIDDLRWFAGSPQGRRILRDWMERSKYGRPFFNGNSQDAFSLGRLKDVSELIAEIKTVALEDFHRLELEAQAEARFAEQSKELPDDDDPDE